MTPGLSLENDVLLWGQSNFSQVIWLLKPSHQHFMNRQICLILVAFRQESTLQPQVVPGNRFKRFLQVIRSTEVTQWLNKLFDYSRSHNKVWTVANFKKKCPSQAFLRMLNLDPTVRASLCFNTRSSFLTSNSPLSCSNTAMHQL